MFNITLKTTEGDIRVRLYGETPIHRDNFVKLCREGYYDQTLFHRVMLQVARSTTRNFCLKKYSN